MITIALYALTAIFFIIYLLILIFISSSTFWGFFTFGAFFILLFIAMVYTGVDKKKQKEHYEILVNFFSKLKKIFKNSISLNTKQITYLKNKSNKRFIIKNLWIYKKKRRLSCMKQEI